MLSQGTKWFNENIYYRKAQNGHKHVTPPGSGHKNRPRRGRISSILGRKAHNGAMKTFVIARHNGTMKTFIIAKHKWYNENIYYRKAQNGNRHVTPPGSGQK